MKDHSVQPWWLVKGCHAGDDNTRFAGLLFYLLLIGVGLGF
jgi:hypothetical protein